ncbi:MAG: hypothetical protein ABIO44_08140 [Saprospiraceae bacterium]
MNTILKDDLDCHYYNRFVYYYPKNLCDSIEISFDSPFAFKKIEDKSEPWYLFSCIETTSKHILKFNIDSKIREELIVDYYKDIEVLDSNLLIHSFSKKYFYFSKIDTSRGVTYSHSFTSLYSNKPVYFSSVTLYPSQEIINYTIFVHVISETSHYGEFNLDNLKIVKCILNSWKINGFIEEDLNKY